MIQTVSSPYTLHPHFTERTRTLTFTVTFGCCGEHVTRGELGSPFTTAGMVSAAALVHRCAR